MIDLSKAFKSYLSTTVRNKCLNYLRDNRKFNRDILEAENLLAETAVDPPDRLGESELRKRISEAIEELPPKCREIFTMNRNDQMKYQEIADRLGISVKTVETQMSKALQHLRLRLAEFLALLVLLLMNRF